MTRPPSPRTPRGATRRLLAHVAVLAVAAAAAAAGAQIAYDNTTFLHGIGSSDTIWKQPYGTLGGRTAPGFLSQQVVLKSIGTPYLNAGAPGRPDSTAGLRYDGQRNNLVQFLTGTGGRHVLVAHSLGSLVGRGAFAQPVVGAARVGGILTMAAPHQGALIADSARFAVQYIRTLEGAVRDAQRSARGVGEFFQILGTITLSPAALIIGHQYVTGASGQVSFPTQSVEGLAALEALKDLGPNAAAVTQLNAYSGDGSVPRANIRGSIPHGHALLRLAAATGPTSFEDLKRTKDKGLSGLRKCRNAGNWTFNLTDPGNRCQRAAALLGGLDNRWAAYVNGTQYGRKFAFVMGQVPRLVPFDGVVPNERSNYPGGGLVRDVTIQMVNHQDIYKRAEGLNAAASAMLAMGMDRADVLRASISGPGEFNTSESLTWQTAPSGGDGTYTYQWAYQFSYGSAWTSLGSGPSASMYVDPSMPSFTLRVTVSSQGQMTSAYYYVTNTSPGGGGNECPPPMLQCE